MAEVKDFQVVQETDGIHVAVVLREGAAREEVARRVEQEVSRRLASLGAVLANPVRVEIRDEFVRDPKRMGKHKVVLSRVPAAAAGAPPARGGAKADTWA